ncbi:Aldedh-domain-containing protein [Artomyces pyxidatus]|uniref:Aldedh-domain-containing protein n=1 Tax=Artomyces pyxidatus TaxID=48021 RepID=A0ACB8SSP8_9AGAM|nr:Aldedh-domain-containing protein [Artomyces pyxidatus]
MGSFLSFLIHPFDTLRKRRNDFDEGNIDDLLYHLTLFFAFGIYTVFRRYQNARNRAVPFHWRTPDAANPNWSAPHIPNARLDSHKWDSGLLPAMGELLGRDYITCFDPATGLHLDTLLADNGPEIQAKIEKATRAQLEWRKTTFADRRRVIRSLKKWLVENQEVCAQTACRDTGKTLVDAELGEIITTCSKMDWLIQHGEQYLKPETRSSPLMMFYKKSQVHYEPLGVVAAIVSWNYPLHNAWSPILASIFAGNGIILKCSEHVLWSTTWFVGAIQQCLRACGFDPELVQLSCCYPDQADALTASPDIKHITFIGSAQVGKLVALAAAPRLTPVTLELGGKDPAIVLPGTDIQKWASVWMRGIFQNAGQNCIGIERLIVHSSIYEEVYQLIVDRVRLLRVGAALAADGVGTGVDMGSMISQERFQTLTDLIAKAKSQGARVEIGGGRLEHPYLTFGAFFQPTVVGDVTPEMDIAQNELFAPVAVIMPYDDIEEAIEIANGTSYALGASVFGPDKYQCLQVAKALECGMVAVNDFGVTYVSVELLLIVITHNVSYISQDLPFGGTKGSGYGRFGGPEGLRSLTNAKAVVVDRWPWLIQTSIPKPLDYPIRSPQQAWDFVSGLIGILYADDWRARFENLQRLIAASR